MATARPSRSTACAARLRWARPAPSQHAHPVPTAANDGAAPGGRARPRRRRRPLRLSASARGVELGGRRRRRAGARLLLPGASASSSDPPRRGRRRRRRALARGGERAAVALSPIGLSPLGGAFAAGGGAALPGSGAWLTDADREVKLDPRLVAFFLGDLTTTAELDGQRRAAQPRATATRCGHPPRPPREPGRAPRLRPPDRRPPRRAPGGARAGVRPRPGRRRPRGRCDV